MTFRHVFYFHCVVGHVRLLNLPSKNRSARLHPNYVRNAAGGQDSEKRTL